MTEELRGNNHRLRAKITELLGRYPELEADVNAIALRQPTNASLEEVNANLQERARAIIERLPDLEDFFDD